MENASNGEKIITLDEIERDLDENDIVITDGTNPVCIAGIMGGLNTEVDDNTKTIVIESAIFNATNIRKTARRLNLRYRAEDWTIKYCYTLNNTVVASPRILISLIECNQTADGKIKIPACLQEYMWKDIIG